MSTKICFEQMLRDERRIFIINIYIHENENIYEDILAKKVK